MSSGSEELKITPHKSKYKVKLFAISDPELSEDVVLHPTAIESINIIQDFESCFQPIVQICCVLPPMVLDFINTHQETMSFILRLQEIDCLSSNINTIDDNFNDESIITTESKKTSFILETLKERFNQAKKKISLNIK